MLASNSSVLAITHPFAIRSAIAHALGAGPETFRHIGALLAHMIAMPGDQSSAKALEARIETEIASDAAFSVLCSNSSEAFDSGIIIEPDWQPAPAHLPTVLTFFALMVLAAAGLWGVSRFVQATIGLPPHPMSGRQQAFFFKSKPRDFDRTG
jgi:hypothetical protein